MAKKTAPKLDLGGDENGSDDAPAEHVTVTRTKLVRMYKDGAHLDVNPDPKVVEDHVRNGWSKVPETLHEVEE